MIRADRVYETTTTTGLGAYALAGAILGYQAFGAVCAVGAPFDYFAEGVAANGTLTGVWETGVGAYAAGNTFSRTTIHASSNGNAAVDWLAGTKRVAITITAATFDALDVLAIDTEIGQINAATRLIQTQRIMAQIA